jgi:C4-dicarboxylate transporter DctM subunit
VVEPWVLELALLIGGLVALMVAGVWVPVALALAGLVHLLFHGGLAPHRAVGPIFWNVFSDFTFTAIPLFILLGEVILRSPMNDKMFRGLTVWLRPVPGGLLHASLLWAAVFSALSGISVATAATVGMVAIPELLERGYQPRLALGSLAAGPTLSIMIPPSVPLIVYGALVQESVVRLYLAAIGPSALLLGLFGAYILVRVLLDRSLVPRAAERAASARELGRGLLDMAPVVGLVAVMLGGMFLGVMTPTEAAGVSVAGALLQSGLERSLTDAIVGAGVTRPLFLAAIVIVYLVLGCFFDPLSTLLLTMPVLYPAVQRLEIDPIWFGIFLVVLIETGLITPPVGINLFVIKGIAGGQPGRGGPRRPALRVAPAARPRPAGRLPRHRALARAMSPPGDSGARRGMGGLARYTRTVREDEVRAYASRGWEDAARLEQDHWVAELERNPLATFEASQALWVHMRQVDPAWPGDEERAEDLAHHLAVKRALDRAAGALAAAAGR